MSISFTSLTNAHFGLLKKWLNTPNVHQWWGESKVWGSKEVNQRYETYVQGYSLEHGIKKPIHAFVIKFDETPIGYIQYYNAHDFSEEITGLKNIPESLAGVDFYIGAQAFVGKDLGAEVLTQFLSDHVFLDFENALVDPDIKNHAAIKTYKKAGFNKTIAVTELGNMLMLCNKLKDGIVIENSMDPVIINKIREGVKEGLERVKGLNDKSTQYAFCARDNNNFIGGVIADIFGKILWIDAIYVIPNKKNQGVGSALIEHLLSYAKERDVDELQSNTFYPEAHQFFTSIGFETVSEIPNWKYGLTCYLMRKLL